MYYAVNLADWVAKKNDVGLNILLSPVTARRETVNAETKRFDGTAVFLECSEERADAIVKVIREKFDRNRMRCYRSKTGRGGWKRV